MERKSFNSDTLNKNDSMSLNTGFIPVNNAGMQF